MLVKHLSQLNVDVLELLVHRSKVVVLLAVVWVGVVDDVLDLFLELELVSWVGWVELLCGIRLLIIVLVFRALRWQALLLELLNLGLHTLVDHVVYLVFNSIFKHALESNILHGNKSG